MPEGELTGSRGARPGPRPVRAGGTQAATQGGAGQSSADHANLAPGGIDMLAILS